MNISKHTKRQTETQDAPTEDTLNSPRSHQILLFLLKFTLPHSENRGSGGTRSW